MAEVASRKFVATFSVTYIVRPPSGISIERFARDIAEEQTVEVPHECIPAGHFSSEIVGCVESIVMAGKSSYKVVIRYRNDITDSTIPLFMNVLYGNISLKQGIRIVDVECSESLLASFGGPRFGIDGIRELCGVYGRPLLAVALKPLGIDCSSLASMAGACARAGIDIIKDDHGIANQQFHPFEERIARVMEAVGAANAASGRLTLYFPNLCGSFEQIDKQARLAVQHGIHGVLLAPQLVGFDAMRYFSQKYNLMIMSHPSFTGTLFTTNRHGLAPALLLGKLFRLFGADISVFPSWGGRFCFSRRECREIAALLTEKTAVRRAFPAPAGGLRLERVGEIGDVYGKDAVLLVGGALLGRSTDLYRSTQEFMEALRGRFSEELCEPRALFGSSCEAQPSRRNSASGSLLSFDDFNWSGCPRTAYKSPGATSFSGISRTELIGSTASETAFDLRYFEINPGGFSSFEKHLHEHVIIGVRGKGILQKGEDSISIGLNDIARVGPFEPHQLRNGGEEPFGFYCIVDRNRDKPVSV